MDSTCICISLRKASRKLTVLYDVALEPAGISLAQFSLLRNIRRHGPVSLTRLADIVELDRSTLGRNVRLLERDGLVALKVGADQREASVGLTAAGRARLDKSTPLWEATQEQIRHKLGSEGTSQLGVLLGLLGETAA